MAPTFVVQLTVAVVAVSDTDTPVIVAFGSVAGGEAEELPPPLQPRRVANVNEHTIKGSWARKKSRSVRSVMGFSHFGQSAHGA